MKRSFKIASLIIVALSSITTGASQDSTSYNTATIGTTRRPHIMFVQAGGSGHYWSIGYGFSFYQKDRHELNSTVGVNFMWSSRNVQTSATPIGVFYRYGSRIKVEAGLSITPIINWMRFGGKSYRGDDGYIIEVPSHKVAIVPSIGMVYASINGRIETGLRYTPMFVIESSGLPAWFGAFFHYRFKRRKE